MRKITYLRSLHDNGTENNVRWKINKETVNTAHILYYTPDAGVDVHSLMLISHHSSPPSFIATPPRHILFGQPSIAASSKESMEYAVD